MLTYVTYLAYQHSARRRAWREYIYVDKNIYRKPEPIPEILAADYTFASIKAATNNFRYPAVVRGLFKDTKAIELWKTEGYLSERLGDFPIPIVRNARVGTLQDDRVIVPFSEAFSEMYRSNYSTEYLFFPVKSRFTFNGSDAGSAAALQTTVDDVCREDLELDRIWPGFGTKRHTSFVGSQFVIGKSTQDFDSEQSTGSDWHCAIGNNWFIQAAGTKRWVSPPPAFHAWTSQRMRGIPVNSLSISYTQYLFGRFLSLFCTFYPGIY
jgi:hypothetical protein